MTYHTGGARQAILWSAGFAIGLFMLCGASLILILSGKIISHYVSGLALLFGLSMSSVPALGLLITVLDGIANIRLDTYEREKRLYADRVSDAAIALSEVDPTIHANAHYHAVKRNLLEFCLWWDRLGSLTGPDFVKAGVVPSGKEWSYYAAILAASGMVLKQNGVPTVAHPNYNPTIAALEIERGEFVMPAGEDKPPRVSPCPAPVVVEVAWSDAKAKATQS